jgi:ABC-type uncharacterized transport system substrate-binding protein
MNKKIVLVGVAILFPVVAHLAEALQPGKVPQIGYLSAESESSPPQPFVETLRDLGYIEGKNIVLEFRTNEDKSARNAELVADLIRLKVDIIVADSSGMTLVAKKATRTIPIVMTSSSDPIATGLIASLAQPGGNITGLTSVTGELGGKFLELLKEIVPRLSRVVVPAPATSPTEDLFIEQTREPARAMNVELIRFGVHGPEDYENIFRVTVKKRANGLLVRLPPSGTPPVQRKQFVELSVKNRLPAIYGTSSWVESGGLVYYGQDRTSRYRRAATYVDKILKGAKPADLPVEQPTKFEFSRRRNRSA